MRLVVATRSAHKLGEIRAILRGVPGLELLDLNDAGVRPTAEEEDIERFETFEENALAKARHFHTLSGLPVVADDSGICVDALGGLPGVRSKRFCPGGELLTDEERDRANNEYLLRLLGDLDLAERKASYVCIAALVEGEGPPHLFEGKASGLILGNARGKGGFGYDPLFFDPLEGKTFAELSPAEKDARSHRGAAFRALAGHLIASRANKG
ncbi:MAG: non-canonical purine NTP pyrophosphatase [Gemmatimonadota bacterium]